MILEGIHEMTLEFFNGHVAPIFMFLGWRPLVGVGTLEPEEGILYLAAVQDKIGNPVANTMVNGLIEACGWSDPSGLVPDQEAGKPPPLNDPFAGRLDLQGVEELMKYVQDNIILKIEDMAEGLYPELKARGWSYGGTSYGDGTFALTSVMDGDNQVISYAEVLTLLQKINFPHRIFHHKRRAPEGEFRTSDTEEALEEVAEQASEAMIYANKKKIEIKADQDVQVSERHRLLTHSGIDTVALKADDKLHLSGETCMGGGARLVIALAEGGLQIYCSPSQALEFCESAEAIVGYFMEAGGQNEGQGRKDGSE